MLGALHLFLFINIFHVNFLCHFKIVLNSMFVSLNARNDFKLRISFSIPFRILFSITIIIILQLTFFFIWPPIYPTVRKQKLGWLTFAIFLLFLVFFFVLHLSI